MCKTVRSPFVATRSSDSQSEHVGISTMLPVRLVKCLIRDQNRLQTHARQMLRQSSGNGLFGVLQLKKIWVSNGTLPVIIWLGNMLKSAVEEVAARSRRTRDGTAAQPWSHLRRTHYSRQVCDIWVSRSDKSEDYCLLGFDTLWPGRNSSLLDENMRSASSSVFLQNEATGSSENIVKVTFYMTGKLHQN
jgi:hypothetical protein